MNNHDFIDILLKKPFDPLWVIIVCNILDGLKLNLYREDFVKDAITKWRENYLKNKSLNPSKKIETLKSALDNLSTTSIQIGCNSSLINSIKSYAHSMYAVSFIHNILHSDDQAALAANGKLGIGKKIFIEDSIPSLRIEPGKSIGRPGGIVFLTSFESVLSLLKSHQKADEIRDKLGLIHWRNQEYVTIQIKASEINALRQGRPTFIDAGIHRRFKISARSYKNKLKKDWGFTVDLGRFFSHGKVVDGVPERVCTQIKSHYISLIDLYPLGFLKDLSRGSNPNDNDKIYAARLCGRRSVKKLKNDIKLIL